MENLGHPENEEKNSFVSSKFRDLFDSINQVLFLFNFMGDILDVNNAACDLLDFSREKLLEMRLYDIISSDFASKLSNDITGAFQTGTKTFESGLKHRDGKIIPIRLFMKIIELNTTKVILATAQESIELESREKEIKELIAILHHIPIPVLRIKQNLVIYANNAAIEIFDIKENEEIEPKFSELITELKKNNSAILTVDFDKLIYTLNIIPALEEDCFTIYGRDITEHTEAEKLISYLAKFPSENPNPVLWVNNDSVLYSNRAGEELFRVKRFSKIPEFLDKVIEESLIKNEVVEKEVEFDDRIYLLNISKVENQDFISIHGIDISERKKAEKMLQQYSHQMEFLNHVIMAGNVASDINSFLEEILSSTLQLMEFNAGVIYLIDANEQFVEIVCSQNISQEIRLKNKVVTFNQEPFKTIFKRRIPLFSDSSSTLYSDDVIFSKFSSTAIIPIFSEDKIMGSISIASENEYFFSHEEKDLLELLGREVGDFIKKMKTEEALSEARIITEFYRDLVVHDISNILQNINMSVELVSLFQEKEEKIEDIFELVGNIKEQIMRGSNLITNIRKLSKISTTGISLEPVETLQFLNDAVKFIQVSFPNKDLNIKIDSPLKKVFVRANEFILDVFENILFNAVKYNNNFSIEILISILKHKYNGKDYLKLEFRDNGIGISDHRKESILNNVSEGKSKVKGMGIGLFTVNKIIYSYGGKIWIEDRIKGDPSKGSNFIILIPLIV